MHNPNFGVVGQEGLYSWQQRLSGYIRSAFTAANLAGLAGILLTLICLFVIPGDQYWNIRIPLYLAACIWTLIRPIAALYLLPFAIPWGSLDPIGSLNSADILVGLLAASWLLSYTLRPYFIRARHNNSDQKDELLPGYLLLAMALLLLAMTLSLLVATNHVASVGEIIKWSEALIILLVGSHYLQTRRQIWTLFICICLGGLSQAVLGYAQVFLNLGPSSFIRGDLLRVYGTFGQPNPYAGYINMILTPALALALLSRDLKTRIVTGSLAVILAGVVYYSQSKGGFLALGIAGLAIFYIGFPYLRPLALAGLIGGLIMLGAVLAGRIPAHFVETTLKQLGVMNISFTSPDPENYANSERLAHWVSGLLMFRDYPLFGVGIGNYEYLYESYAQGIFLLPLGHSHNYYINMAAESGVPGILTFSLFLLTVFVAGGRAYIKLNQLVLQHKQSITHPPLSNSVINVESHHALQRYGILVNDRAFAVGLLAALLTVCAHNMVDNLYVHGMTSLFALLLLLLIRLGRVS